MNKLFQVLIAITLYGSLALCIDISKLSREERKQLLGDYTSTKSIPSHLLASADHLSDIPIPPYFYAVDKWGKWDCIHPIRDQAHCGSCWAFTVSEVLSDRFCIHSQGKINKILSPQYLVSCDPDDNGCSGGNAEDGFNYTIKNGIVADACVPYTSQDGEVADCPVDKCTVEGEEFKLYKCLPDSTRVFNTEDTIKRELMTNGPMYVRFGVPMDFMDYLSGLYYQTSTVIEGGHAIKLLGWGIEDGIKYWIIANSWGDDWGENGRFRPIVAEVSDLVEFAWACMPDIQ